MNSSKPLLIPNSEDRQDYRFPERVAATRWNKPWNACQYLHQDMAARISASKAQFPWTFFRGDCHSHTQHSDGCGTVAETAEIVQLAGLDFQFVTDHWGITQAPECIEHGLWFGQEPTTQWHHLGILGLDYAFEPRQDFLADYAAAVEAGATVFVPHPTGWWPTKVYEEESLRILEELPSPFLMEICNGANNIVSAFDYTDDAAIALWDHLLGMGRQVHAMGNTDAHMPHAIGIVWNGVFAENCEQSTILSQIKAGHSFVSDAPLLHIALGQARMGDRATVADRTKELEITAVDARGLDSVAVIADGAEIFYQHFRGEEQWNGQLEVPDNIEKYLRVEVRSHGARRAYSNPIYLAPQ